MLLVALSLRMCCSRVCRASRYTSLPAASLKSGQKSCLAFYFENSTPCLWWGMWHSPGDSDHTARHHAHQVVSDSEEGGVRTAVAEGNPKPLRAAQRNVHAELPGRTQHAESQQVRGTAGQRLDSTQSKKRKESVSDCVLANQQCAKGSQYANDGKRKQTVSGIQCFGGVTRGTNEVILPSVTCRQLFFFLSVF